MFDRQFLADMAERTIATLAQVALGLLTTGLLLTKEGGVTVLIAGLATILKCLAATRVGADNTAAMLTQKADTEEGHYDVPSVLIMTAVAIIVWLVMYAIIIN